MLALDNHGEASENRVYGRAILAIADTALILVPHITQRRGP